MLGSSRCTAAKIAADRRRPRPPATSAGASDRSSRPRNSSSSTSGASSATPTTTSTTSGPVAALERLGPPPAGPRSPPTASSRSDEPERDDLEQHPGRRATASPGPGRPARSRRRSVPEALGPAHARRSADEDRHVLREQPDDEVDAVGGSRPRPGPAGPARSSPRRHRRPGPANQTQTTSPSPQRSARRVGLGAALTAGTDATGAPSAVAETAAAGIPRCPVVVALPETATEGRPALRWARRASSPTRTRSPTPSEQSPTRTPPRARQAAPAAAPRRPRPWPRWLPLVVLGIVVAIFLFTSVRTSNTDKASPHLQPVHERGRGRAGQERRRTTRRTGRSPASSRRAQDGKTEFTSSGPNNDLQAGAAQEPREAGRRRQVRPRGLEPARRDPAVGAAARAHHRVLRLDEPARPGPDGRGHEHRPQPGEGLQRREAEDDVRRRRRATSR